MTESSKTAPARPSVGVVRESAAGERRVALVPKIVAGLAGRSVEVVVEAGAGEPALIPDEAFVEAGGIDR